MTTGQRPVHGATRRWVDILPTLLWLVAVGVAVGVLIAIG